MAQLQSLSKMFNEKIFRIPDYQRGYAWRNQNINGQIVGQLVDFWEDLVRLDKDRKHYTGVITLERASEEQYRTWIEELWIIKSKGYKPYFIVDGQQRLMTIIILLQTIVEFIGEDGRLNYDSVKEIRKKYIFEQKDGSINRTYIFGYEKDNPSNEFLRTRIFKEHSFTNVDTETTYTLNLENAKKFFLENLKKLSIEQIEEIYIKTTQNLLFNEYIIEDDIDVCVAFETMNNRGKKLSNLELLKNRLIYISTLISDADEEEKSSLRLKINDCWKTIYEYLGKNKENPLDDDEFLRIHWIMYYTYSRRRGDDYARFLFTKKFVAKLVYSNDISSCVMDNDSQENAIDDEVEDDDDACGEDMSRNLVVGIAEITAYVESLQKSVKKWHDIRNPFSSQKLSGDEQNFLDKINRLGISYFGPLILASCCATEDKEKLVCLFKSIERFIFLLFRISQQRTNTGSSKFYRMAKEVFYKQSSIDDAIKELNEWVGNYFDLEAFRKYIRTKFSLGKKNGFFGWEGLRYFLYEYELSLFRDSKTSNQKILWEKFINKKDCLTIEHILPQDASKQCWQHKFGKFSQEQQNKLTNTLGNLLALSQPKNSALLNDCFEEKKVDKKERRGYFNGSYSENRVALKKEWTAEEIRERSLEMLRFMEQNWKIEFGTDEEKTALLQLDFLIRDDGK